MSATSTSNIANKVWMMFKKFPKGLKITTLLLMACLAIIVVMMVSCGTTKAVVKNPRQSATTTISVTTTNPTSITTDVPLNLTLKHQGKKVVTDSLQNTNN